MPKNVQLLLLLLSGFSRVRLCATQRRQPTRLPHPWDCPGENTGVGCHFLLQVLQIQRVQNGMLNISSLYQTFTFLCIFNSINGTSCQNLESFAASLLFPVILYIQSISKDSSSYLSSIHRSILIVTFLVPVVLIPDV